MVLIKKIINKIFYLLGFELKKRKSFHDSIELIKRIEKVNPIIFDVGANEGQSIKEYLNIFNIQKFILLNHYIKSPKY